MFVLDCDVGEEVKIERGGGIKRTREGECSTYEPEIEDE